MPRFVCFRYFVEHPVSNIAQWNRDQRTARSWFILTRWNIKIHFVSLKCSLLGDYGTNSEIPSMQIQKC